MPKVLFPIFESASSIFFNNFRSLSLNLSVKFRSVSIDDLSILSGNSSPATTRFSFIVFFSSNKNSYVFFFPLIKPFNLILFFFFFIFMKKKKFFFFLKKVFKKKNREFFSV